MDQRVNKLCDINKLEEFSNMLEILLYGNKKLSLDNILSLQLFFEIHIMEKPKEIINSIKKEIYFSMKKATNQKEKQMYYEIYQKIKLDVQEAEKND